MAELTDDEITAMIEDTALILTHEHAVEIIAVLEEEIAGITAQLTATEFEAKIQAPSPEKMDWVRRASYALAMKKNGQHRVMQRDKEIRGTKSPAGSPGERAAKQAATRLREERLTEEAKTRALALQVKHADFTARQMEEAGRRKFSQRFYDLARAELPPEQLAKLEAAARS